MEIDLYITPKNGTNVLSYARREVAEKNPRDREKGTSTGPSSVKWRRCQSGAPRAAQRRLADSAKG